MLTIAPPACREASHTASATVQPMAALTPYIPHQAQSHLISSSKFKCSASTLRCVLPKETFSIQNWQVGAAFNPIANCQVTEINTPTLCKLSPSCRLTKANRGPIHVLMNRPETVSSPSIRVGKTRRARPFHRRVTVFQISVVLTKLLMWALRWSTST